MQLPNRLMIHDELTIYLVSKGLKPAGLINLTPIPNINDEMVKVKTKKNKNFTSVNIRFKSEFRKEMINYLSENELISKLKKWRYNTIPIFYDKKKLNQEVYYGFNIYYANKKNNLEQLLTAKTDKTLGLALGFPEEAINSYKKVINDELRCSSYTGHCMAMAKQEGIELPTWLAYISYIPEELDFVNGSVSKSTKFIGEKYQNFVREHNSDLAERLESNFKFNIDILPTKWVKREDKGYLVLNN